LTFLKVTTQFFQLVKTAKCDLTGTKSTLPPSWSFGRTSCDKQYNTDDQLLYCQRTRF